MMHSHAYHVQYASSHQADESAATHNMDINAAICLYCRASDTTHWSQMSVVLASTAAQAAGQRCMWPGTMMHVWITPLSKAHQSVFASQPVFGALHVAGGVHVTLLPGIAVGSTDDNMLQHLGADLTSRNKRRVGLGNEPRGRAARCGLHLQTQTALSGGPA